MKNLSPKEKLFCAYCLVGRSPREAAAKSGYLFPEKAGMKLLTREKIKAYLENERKEKSKNAALLGCQRLAFGSAADAVRLVFSEEAPSGDEIEKMDLFLISEIKRPKGGGLEVKFFDRLKALERLERLLESADESDGRKSIYGAIENSALKLGECEDEPND